MKILFLTHKMPYPANKGDRIPTYHRLMHLSKKHEVSLAFPCFCKKELKHLEILKKRCVSVDTVLIRPFWAKIKSLFAIFSKMPLTLPYFYSRHLHKMILKRIKKEGFDLIYVYSSSMAQYVFDVKGVKKVIDLADSDSHKWLQYSKHTSPPLSLIYYLEWRRLKEYEKLLAKTFDHSIAISEDEKRLFSTYIPDAEMSVVSNGVDLNYFRSPRHHVTTSPERKNSIIFVGAMDYFANVDAVIYFYREIFPLIRQQIPNIIFYIAGSRPSRSIRKLDKDRNIIVTGFVEDVRPYLKNSSVFVAPLRIARGIQNKILEAMASGVPVVTTSKGNEGINAEDDKEILVGDTPQDFARGIIRIIRDEDLRERLARNGRVFVEERHNWEANLRRLEEVLVGVLDIGNVPKDEGRGTKGRLEGLNLRGYKLEKDGEGARKRLLRRPDFVGAPRNDGRERTSVARTRDDS